MPARSVHFGRKQRYEAAVSYVYGPHSISDVATMFRVAPRTIRALFDQRLKEYGRAASRTCKTKRSLRTRCRDILNDQRYRATQEGYAANSATPDEMVLALTQQDFRCGICRQQYRVIGHGGLVADHCHNTGEFRGWLCNKCNTGLSTLEKYPSLALAYLTKEKSKCA